MNELQKIVAQLYARLETIWRDHEEVTDTDVREALHETLNYYFVWAMPVRRLPRSYATFSEAGDQAVSKAVAEFLSKAETLATQHGIPVGRDRLAVLQDGTIRTPQGEQYDLFIGHADEPLNPQPLPSSRFEPGEYGED